MSNPGTDPWAVASAPNDPWSPAGNTQQGWTPSEDEARDTIQRLVPGSTITSQGRTAEKNAAVGGAPNSMHLTERATDFVLPKGKTAAQVRAQLEAEGYPVTEFLDEGDHIHWGWGPKGGKTGTLPADPWAPAQETKLAGSYAATPEAAQQFEALKSDKAPSAPIMDAIAAAVKTTPQSWKQLGAGVMQFIGEHPSFLTPTPNVPLSADEQDAWDKKFAPITGPAGKQLAEAARKIYADASADLKEKLPDMPDGSAAKYAYQITRGVIDILPIIAATAVTKSPIPGAALMGVQAGASKYGEARASGRSVDQASMDAAFTGTVNSALGGMKIGFLMKPGQSFLGKVIGGAGTFGAISVMTEALQLGYDKGLVTPDMTLQQAWARLKDAGIVGTLTGGFVGGGHAGLETAINRFHSATPAPEKPTQTEPAKPVQAPPAPPPSAPSAAGPLHAAVRSALGLERPGVPPAADPWAPVGAPSGYEPPSPEGEALNREFPKVPEQRAAPTPETRAIEHRALEPDTAITATGREVPVRYAVVEAKDLIPSQTTEGNPNPAYPGELQPRDRTRAVSQAQIASIAQNINPRLLDRSVNASDGAPIIAPSGVVESGNGRTLAIQRAYAEGLPSAGAYRDYLARAGYPVENMTHPVLVRLRTGEMAPEDRQAFVREANQAGQLGYSATERAMSDAALLPDYALGLFRGGDVDQAHNREFVKAFMTEAMPTNEHAAMVDANGTLSLDGLRRVRAALLAKAYSDPDMVVSVVESPDSNIKAIGGALTDAAADWARMRSQAASGDIPPALDQTHNLLEAAKLVAQARASGRNVAELVGQKDIFTGNAIDPDVEAWLRLMFRNTQDWTQPVGRDRLADAIRFYAQEAQKVSNGANLLGEPPLNPGQVLEAAKAKQYGESTGQPGPSLSFGEDDGLRRQQGAGPGFESAPPGRSQGNAQSRAEAIRRAALKAPFGPASEDFPLSIPSADTKQSLSREAEGYVAASGIDRANRPQTMAALANWVWKRGKLYRYESLAGLGADGKIYASTNGESGSVTFGADLMLKLLDPAERIITVHNHPSSSAPSAGDIGTLAYPGHAALLVVGHDATPYAIRLIAKVAPDADVNKVAGLLAAAQKGARGTGRKLADTFYNEQALTPKEADEALEYMSMAPLARAGLIDYMGPGVERLPARVHQEVENEIDRITKTVEAYVEKFGPAVGVRAAPAGSAERVYRSSGPLLLAQDVSRLLGEPQQNAGQPASAPGQEAGGRGPAPYRKPTQLKLLEEEKRYPERPFYSALTRSIETTKMSRAPAKDWAGLIDNLPGVKKEEVEWSGIKDWLNQQTGPVTRQQVADYLRSNEVQVQEVEKGSGLTQKELLEYNGLSRRNARPDNLTDDEMNRLNDLEARKEGSGNTKYASHVLPGGENYREMLLTLPEGTAESRRIGNEAADYAKQMREKYGEQWLAKSNIQEAARYSALINRASEVEGKPFKSGHFDEPNIIAHVRFDDRTGPNGEKILHIAEVQSDWHQKGRRGGYNEPADKWKESDIAESSPRVGEVGTDDKVWFEAPDGTRAPGWKSVEADRGSARQQALRTINRALSKKGIVPDAPFKSTWQELAAKRMLRYAAENGYQKLSWDTGETQAARYDLSKHLSRVDWIPNANDFEKDHEGTLIAFGKDGNRPAFTKAMKASEIPEHVGKDVADKLLRGENLERMKAGLDAKVEGLDLKVGGEGMKGFYDRILPAFLNKYAKKWGAKVEEDAIPADKHGWHITLPSETASGKWMVKSSDYNSTGLQFDSEQMARAALADKIRKATVHSIPITESMRESVMEGQPLFEEKRRYAEEAGAVDAQGRALPQTIIPGAEPSATQLAKAREASGGGKVATKVAQKQPGGLFGGDGETSIDQLSLFEDPRRYGEIPHDDREVLERAARTGNWIAKFGAQAGDAGDRIRAAISGAYESWKERPSSVPQSVRDVFGRLGGSGGGFGGGGGGGKLPGGFEELPTSRPTESFRDRLRRITDRLFSIGHDVEMLVAPMATGTTEARAVAKDFANGMRLARWHGQRMDERLKRDFTPDQRRKMWEAADQESVLRQTEQPTAGKGLSTLSADERLAVLEQQADAQAVWQAAKDQGMVEGEGLPSYVPRMMVEMGSEGARHLGSSENPRSIPGMGRNVRTSTPQMKQRKYLTTGETELAGSQKFETEAQVVKDIRTLPLATARLREAVAGRALINKIKEIGAKTGEDTVVEGYEPSGTEHKWFTLDNAAFKTWAPKMIKEAESGKYVAAKDQNGETVFEKIPIYVRGDFEGPLRAVLSQESGRIYNGLMSLKGRAMTAIMYSPLIHNAVEWGRALPAMPGKVLTLRVYFEGNRAKHNPEIMTEAIMHGLAPIGHNFGRQDITGIANFDNIKAGRSWTAKVLGAIPGLFSKDAQQAVYRAIDKTGDLWHNTLLWDRVGDLQMGLYTNLRDKLVRKGYSKDAAAFTAAHLANRYAGALPLESMSNMARKIANLTLFSRTYTLGNLGAMKDVITGLPRDVQAQIERSGGLDELKKVRSMARRKAIAILITDIALFYAANSLLQDGLNYLSQRKDSDEIVNGYVDRLKGLSQKANDSPADLLNPFADLEALSSTSENEPGKENRVLVGFDKDGTGIYARNPTGKIGEEFVNWLGSPLQTTKNKLSTLVRPSYELLANDAGFGRHVYDPNAKGFSGLARNIGDIVSLYMSNQIPVDSLKSAAEVMKGSEKSIDLYKTVGPLAGVTFSKGAPGGPGMGEYYALKDSVEAAQTAALPAIREKIRGGDIVGARRDMTAVGISPGLQNYYVRTTLNPRLRLNTRNARELLRQASPEERARVLQLEGAQ